jgi:hypothetical protein
MEPECCRLATGSRPDFDLNSSSSGGMSLVSINESAGFLRPSQPP